MPTHLMEAECLLNHIIIGYILIIAIVFIKKKQWKLGSQYDCLEKRRRQRENFTIPTQCLQWRADALVYNPSTLSLW